MSFSETIFLFVLALVVFGPKKLPEIARQAGKLLAELRRASNEFKSQIETEIAHLEVEKRQTVLPPSGPPPGAVATMSLNPTTVEAAPHQTQATLAAPAEAESAAPTSVDEPMASISSSPPSEQPSSPSPAASSSSDSTQDTHA